MTQLQVAEKLGISHQQVHKIEKAVQRISAGQLFAIAGALNVTVSDLLDGYGSTPTGPAVDAETTRMLLDLRRSFLSLEPKHQEALVRLAQALAAADCSDAERKNAQPSAAQERASPPARKRSG